MITNTLQTIYENPVLQEIYRGTIRAHSAKAGYKYPTIHLPVAFSGLIGLRTRIFQTVHDGALAFLVVVSPSGSASENAATGTRPPYLHGEGRRFEFGRAHCLFCQSAALEPSINVFSDTRIMAKKRYNKDKKLHNFSEKLHNSDVVNDEPDLSWQEHVDLVAEDEIESGSEIYYFTDEDGNIHSREFLAEELIPNDVEDQDDSLKSRHEKVQRLKPSSVEIVNLVPASGETPGEISLPVPKSGARPVDIRISSEVIPDLFTKKESQSEGVEENRQVIVHLQDRLAADEPSRTVHDRDDRTPLVLNFTQAELDAYVSYRSEGLAAKSKDWITRSSEALWESTRGEISHQTMTRLRTFVLEKYNSVDSHSKVLSFAVGFLNFLAQTNIDPRYVSFKLFLERPKAKKVKKALTEKIITREDIGAVFQRITAAEEGGTDPSKIRNYRAFALLASYTGLRPSTLERLTVGQFRTALREEKPVLHVLAEQEKNRIEHYVPLHPTVIGAINEVLNNDFGEKDDAKPFFMFYSFQNWIERQKIPLTRVRDPSKARMWLSDFRKFAE